MNARITKEKAAQIALKLCEKKKDDLVEAESKLSFFVYDIAKRKTPKDVAIAFEKHKDYIRHGKFVYVSGQGISTWTSANLSESIPLKSGGTIEFTQQEAEKFLELSNKALKAKSNYKELVEKVENALLSCRTYSKVKELFPEALPYLPPVYDPPALNFSEVRKALK